MSREKLNSYARLFWLLLGLCYGWIIRDGIVEKKHEPSRYVTDPNRPSYITVWREEMKNQGFTTDEITRVELAGQATGTRLWAARSED